MIGGRAMRILRITLVVVVVVGLAVDAYVHLHLARTFDPIRGTISQGQLFRVEGYAAILAGLFLLVRPGRWSAAVAAVVAGGGLAAVLVYAVVDVGPLGPLPNMYDPTWSSPKATTGQPWQKLPLPSLRWPCWRSAFGNPPGNARARSRPGPPRGQPADEHGRRYALLRSVCGLGDLLLVDRAAGPVRGQLVGPRPWGPAAGRPSRRSGTGPVGRPRPWGPAAGRPSRRSGTGPVGRLRPWGRSPPERSCWWWP